MKFSIVIKKVRDNLYIASVPELKGCHVQAQTAEEVRERIKEAIKAYIQSFQQHNEKLPL